MSKPEARPPTPFQRFAAFAKRVIAVHKAEVDEREATYRKQRDRKRRRGKCSGCPSPCGGKHSTYNIEYTVEE